MKIETSLTTNKQNLDRFCVLVFYANIVYYYYFIIVVLLFCFGSSDPQLCSPVAATGELWSPVLQLHTCANMILDSSCRTLAKKCLTKERMENREKRFIFSCNVTK